MWKCSWNRSIGWKILRRSLSWVGGGGHVQVWGGDNQTAIKLTGRDSLCSAIVEDWKVEQNFEQDIGTSAVYVIPKLEFLRNGTSVRTFHDFLGYKLRSTLENEAGAIVAGSIVWLASLDFPVGTLVNCLSEKWTQGGHRLKLYDYTFGTLSQLEIDQWLEEGLISGTLDGREARSHTIWELFDIGESFVEWRKVPSITEYVGSGICDRTTRAVQDWCEERVVFEREVLLLEGPSRQLERGMLKNKNIYFWKPSITAIQSSHSNEKVQ